MKRFKLFKPGRVTYLLGLVLILSVDTSFSQQSRFSLDIGLIGMRVTPQLQSNFVQNDWIWTDPTTGDEYFGFSGSEPRGMRFKWHYRITKNLSFQIGEDILNRTYYINGFFDPDENGKFSKARVVGLFGFDDKSSGFELLSSSTQFGLDWNVFIKKNSFQFYTTLNYDFYEFNQARRDLPGVFSTVGELENGSVKYYTTGKLRTFTLNTTEQGITNNFWSLNTGVAYSRQLKDRLRLKVDVGFRNTALWKKYAFDKNAVVLELEHSRYNVDDVFYQNPTYTIKRNYDFPLYLGGFYLAAGLNIDLFQPIEINDSTSFVKRVLTHLIQLK